MEIQESTDIPHTWLVRMNTYEVKVGSRIWHCCPSKGSMIFYNEGSLYNLTQGAPEHERRGFGKVVGYTNELMFIDVMVSERYHYVEAFRISDIVMEIFKYKVIRDVRYRSKYSYTEMDLDNPAEDIAQVAYDSRELIASDTIVC